ncbi:unnamed protein product [Withania somnifera]
MASSSSATPTSNILTLKPTNNEASSSSEPQLSKILTLKSSDDREFKMEESIAIQSGTIKHMVENGYTVIPLVKVESKMLIKILYYMISHHDEKTEANADQLREFDKEFVNVSIKKLSDLLFAANYLHIPGLMDLLCQTIANKIKNKSVDAVRKIFNITNDYSTVEEAEILREHEWAHEGQFDDTIDDDDMSEEE